MLSFLGIDKYVQILISIENKILGFYSSKITYNIEIEILKLIISF